MLDHVIKDENSEFVSLLLTTAECCWDDFSCKLADQLSDKVFMRLEESSHKLSKAHLQIMLVLVLLLEQSEIILVKLVVLILWLFFLHVIVFLDTLEGFFNELKALGSNSVDFFLGVDAYTSLSDVIFNSLHLEDAGISVKLLVNSLENVFVVKLSHCV